MQGINFIFVLTLFLPEAWRGVQECILLHQHTRQLGWSQDTNKHCDDGWHRELPSESPGVEEDYLIEHRCTWNVFKLVK